MTRPILSAEFARSGIAADGCWKRIGTRGDKSCPELARHVHCRDCPTFSLAAAALLDREVPEHAVSDVAAERPASVASAPEAQTEAVVVFRVGAEWFALPTRALDEIVGARPIHSLPHKRSPALLGLVNVRGELVTCVSLAPLLLGTTPEPAVGRLIVIRHPGGRLACPVDEVQHTHHHAADRLEPVPATVSRSQSSLSRGLLAWQDRTVARLDEEALFDALARSLA